MAKVTCPECLKQVEDTADFCPHCGHQILKEEYTGTQVYVEQQPWRFRNTFVVLLLTLLILAVGAFLFFYGLKWPYEDAMRYYRAEKAAFEQQVEEYRNTAAEIDAANERLDAKIAEASGLLNTSEEPLDPETRTALQSSIARARTARVDSPAVEAGELPRVEETSILRYFHAGRIQETGKLIDQQRYSLHQQYGGIQTPDYTLVEDGINRAEQALRESIQRKKDQAGVSEAFRKEMDEYETFMMDYLDFMAGYHRGDLNDINTANELQTRYMRYVNWLRAMNQDLLSDADKAYLDAVTARVRDRMNQNNLTDAMLEG